jgi:hypothetical protein
MVKLRSSWFLSTLVGRLTTALATAIILLGIAGGTIYALTVALNAEHQSQAICGLAGDVARTPIHNVIPPVGKTGLSFVKDARAAYFTGNCVSINGPLPPPAPELIAAFPGIK